MLENAQKLLKKYYGYTTFREGQEKIINSILSGRDTFTIMPTGAGKSVCFQIPALLLPGITLVVSPLISLMKDQVDALDNIGIPATFINSSLSFNEVNKRISKAQKGQCKLLYIAPERLESEDFCELLKHLKISLLAVDEAHCVSQWGHDFRPSYRSISRLINELPIKPVIAAFTATATEEVKLDVITLLKLSNPYVLVTGFDRKNLFFSVINNENKEKFVTSYINSKKEDSGIIYAATRKDVDKLYELFHKKGVSVGKYHAGLSDAERISSQEAFLYDDIRIIVATNAFGMGIDKSNVRYVIHYNMPKNMESYYQEAGRAGRDGEPSECILLFGPQDIIVQKFLIEQTTFSPERRTNEYRKLQTMVDYCHTQRCLRKYMLEYFEDVDIPDTCDNCSNCHDDSEVLDITLDAQKIFSCILRVKERFGISLIADVLKGSKNKRVRELGFDSLSTYGLLKDYETIEIKDLINLLIAEGYIYVTESEYPVVKIKQKAGPVLKNLEKVYKKATKIKQNTVENSSLLDALKKLRRDISGKEKVPPYIIFSDSVLHEMCISLPLDEDSLLSIKGVGEVKLKKYGTVFLNIIKEYSLEHGLTPILNNIKAVNTPEKPKDNPSHVITLDMYLTGLSLEEIAKKRSLNINTIQDHIIRCRMEGHVFDLSAFIPGKYEAVIMDAINKVGCEKLRPIKDALPNEVDYMAIKAAICKTKIS